MTRPRSSPAGRAWCRCSTSGWPASSTSSTSAGCPSCRASSGRTGTSTIGAATRDAVIERDPTVAADVPLLAAATPHIGHFQIRNRGTIGGSLAHADPAAEYPAVAVALDATFRLASSSGTRAVAAADFFTGVWSTALEPDELLTAVELPVWTGRTGVGVAEFARRHGDFAIAGAVAAVELDATTRHPGGDRPVRRRRHAGAGHRRRARPHRAPGRRARRPRARRAGVRRRRRRRRRPAGPGGYRRRVGMAMVAEAWQRAVAQAQDGARSWLSRRAWR